MARCLRWLMFMSGLFAIHLVPMAIAATITQFTPTGLSSVVNQVRVTFSDPVVLMGDEQQPAPFDMACPVNGSGRWLDNKRWVYDFSESLPAGLSCQFTLRQDFVPIEGGRITGQKRFQFSTGGPSPRRVQAADGGYYQGIEEDTIFQVFLTGEVNESSVQKNVWCETNAVQEKIPVRIIRGQQRKHILGFLSPKVPEDRLLLLTCARPLPPGGKMSLVWGKGVSNPKGDIVTTEERRFEYKIRLPFTVKVSCSRQNAKANCTPNQPIALEFSSPVSLAMAKKVALKTPRGLKQPDLTSKEDPISVLRFSPPFDEQAAFSVELPENFQDDSGRKLSKIQRLPLTVKTDGMPPLAKFSGDFGILESKEGGILPLSLRKVETAKEGQAAAKVYQLYFSSDSTNEELVNWYQQSQGFNHAYPVALSDKKEKRDSIDNRSLPRVKGNPDTIAYDLPKPHGEKAFEVIGLPLKKTGLHVLEIESRRLGEAYIETKAPMYVRTVALVTNMAVHFKRGQNNGLIWVTQLNNGKPVAQANVQLTNCKGHSLWSGTTNELGLAMVPGGGFSQEALTEDQACEGGSPIFVIARKEGDISFVSSWWNRGIEAWRFNVPLSYFAWDSYGSKTPLMHAVLDRTLFKAGETVSAKLFARHLVPNNGTTRLVYPTEVPPTTVKMTHWESDETIEVALNWDKRGTALLSYDLPPNAKLGRYDLYVDNEWVGEFYVSDFRLPILTGDIRIFNENPAQLHFPVSVQLNYLSGGPASGYPIELSALMEDYYPNFEGLEDYRFDYDEQRLRSRIGEGMADKEDNSRSSKLILDRQRVVLDDQGNGKIELKDIPPSNLARRLVTEMHFRDPSGEAQAISHSAVLWPADVMVGIRADTDWGISPGSDIPLKLVTVDSKGNPSAHNPVTVTAYHIEEYTHRRRAVGAFYTYESFRDVRKIGEICSGKTDRQGRLECKANLKNATGNIIFVANTVDKRRQTSKAMTEVWVNGKDNGFYTDAQDRIDIVPEKRHYMPGENAVFQVRMPFREATALIAVEREGIMRAFVKTLSGDNPTLEIPIEESDGPNIFVSVLAVRGRIEPIGWDAFWEWGWKRPLEWFKAWKNQPKQPVTAMVDLTKPAYKFGLTQIQVGNQAHDVTVKVRTDQKTYQVGETVKAIIEVALPDGSLLPSESEVALVVVDQALLELKTNDSWKLKEAMYPGHTYGVETATAQMEVVGKRHYGRKALPAGGGGGFIANGQSREKFDPLLLWSPRIKLDQQGRAEVSIPLNDSLTTFTLVAVADVGEARFGTGKTQIQTIRELQLYSGISPVIREGDQQVAMITVRNATNKPMNVVLSADITIDEEESRKFRDFQLSLPPGASQEAQWTVDVPAGVKQVDWRIQGHDANNQLSDTISVSQTVLPLVPVTVRQAFLTQLDKPLSWKTTNPVRSLPGKSRIDIGLSASMGGDLSSLREYFQQYPFNCLEQQVAKAVGLSDESRWKDIMNNLGNYMTGNGLLQFFPSDNVAGSVPLTAHVLRMSAETGWEIPKAHLTKIQQALIDVVEGRIKFPASDAYYSHEAVETKIMALSALSRYQQVKSSMLHAIPVDLQAWSTETLLDWLRILMDTPNIPHREEQIQQVDKMIRARLVWQGTKVTFSTGDKGYRWVIFSDSDTTAIRLALFALNNPQWQENAISLFRGALDRQYGGRWQTTTANAWGVLLLEKVASMHTTKLAGTTIATLNGQEERHRWKGEQTGELSLSWGAAKLGEKGELKIAQQGGGKPWVSVRHSAAVPLTAPVANGFNVTREVIPIAQRSKGQWSRGDRMRIRLTIEATGTSGWTALSDPIPAGAKILGTDLARESVINPNQSSFKGAYPAFEERHADRYVAYFSRVSEGTFVMEYVIQLNTVGDFGLSPTRIESLYAPEVFGETPNARVVVKP